MNKAKTDKELKTDKRQEALIIGAWNAHKSGDDAGLLGILHYLTFRHIDDTELYEVGEDGDGFWIYPACVDYPKRIYIPFNNKAK